MTIGIAATLLGALLLSIGMFVDASQAMFSYLAAWIFAMSVSLGALLWVQMAHTLRAAWMVVLRRRAEDLVAALPVLAILFIPILLRLSTLYPWARPESEWTERLRESLAQKHGWLSPAAFTARSIFYLMVFVLTGELLRRYSRQQDRTPSPELDAKLTTTAVALLPVVAFTLTFAAFDWLMALDPTWSSTVFGIYLFAGGFAGAVGLLCMVVFGRSPARVEEATREHSHALGRILLTFVIFWMYIAFAQFFLIWIADVPAEVGWVKIRTTRSWEPFAVVLVFVHFVLPFFLLLSRELKRRPALLAWMGAWLFVAHYVDMHWVILPNLHAEFRPHWLDLAALLAVLGAAFVAILLRSRGEPETPVHDPRLEEGLEYQAS
jgi:hypothetical protein